MFFNRNTEFFAFSFRMYAFVWDIVASLLLCFVYLQDTPLQQRLEILAEQVGKAGTAMAGIFLLVMIILWIVDMVKYNEGTTFRCDTSQFTRVGICIYASED
jgi:hypothetical protein